MTSRPPARRRWRASRRTTGSERKHGKAGKKSLQFRIGINLGDVIIEDEDIHGDGVNVASRLEGLAEPGGICASRAVFEQIKTRLDLDHVDLGEQTVKNIAEPIHAYRISSKAAPAGRRPTGQPAPPRLEEVRGSIVFFPFESLSPDPDDAYPADGIAMEIIGMLSKINDLRVAFRPATFARRGRSDHMWKVVRDLQLRYVLTGSVRRAGDRVRVTAELSDAADRSQLWSETYQRQLDDLFAIQEEIA